MLLKLLTVSALLLISAFSSAVVDARPLYSHSALVATDPIQNVAVQNQLSALREVVKMASNPRITFEQFAAQREEMERKALAAGAPFTPIVDDIVTTTDTATIVVQPPSGVKPALYSVIAVPEDYDITRSLITAVSTTAPIKLANLKPHTEYEISVMAYAAAPIGAPIGASSLISEPHLASTDPSAEQKIQLLNKHLKEIKKIVHNQLMDEFHIEMELAGVKNISTNLLLTAVKTAEKKINETIIDAVLESKTPLNSIVEASADPIKTAKKL